MLRRTSRTIVAASLAVLACAPGARAQDKGTVDPKPLPPLANPSDPKLPAKELFGRKGDAGAARGARDRLLFQGLPRRRRWRSRSTARPGR